ncbi:MAG: hypothetical protein EOP50_01725 [Sphingobacteriales bacterium]|nr:MAG: hypothetical protein EOP50_01725 [Sphingobacteriales bacterium]
MRYALILVASALLTPQNAYARTCNPVFADKSQTVSIRAVEIDARSAAIENFQLRVVNGDDAQAEAGERQSGCAAVLRISRVDAAILPEFPRYQLRAPANPDVEILATSLQGRTARSDVVITGVPSGRSGRGVPLQFVVPTEWGLKSGVYSEQLLVSLYDEAGVLRDQSTVNLVIQIPAAVSVRIVGAIGGDGRGSARVDLGDLSPTSDTRSQPFGARILSTTAYGVSFQSENSGALVNTGGAGRIPYRLYYEGRLVDLAGANFFPEPSHTTASGDVRPLQVIVPATTANAGLYRDRVTVLVTAI